MAAWQTQQIKLLHHQVQEIIRAKHYLRHLEFLLLYFPVIMSACFTIMQFFSQIKSDLDDMLDVIVIQMNVIRTEHLLFPAFDRHYWTQQVNSLFYTI